MTKSFTISVALILTAVTVFGQTTTQTKKNYCNWTGCHLSPSDPMHFNPYYNGHLCENFNPQQTDFSKEYLELRTKRYTSQTNQLSQTVKYDFSQIWLSGNWQQNGIIGPNCQRIQIHIDNVSKSEKKPDTYLVTGKSKVNNNICNFSGEIKLLKVYYSEYCEDSSKKQCGVIFANYVFYEDSSQNHSGIFKGTTDCDFYTDNSKGKLDDTFDGADGYENRSFVGTWTDYKSKEKKKCIWGDYRLPFSFDFDIGDGEMHVNDKYKNNGWQSFNTEAELGFTEDNKPFLKNRWW